MSSESNTSRSLHHLSFTVQLPVAIFSAVVLTGALWHRADAACDLSQILASPVFTSTAAYPMMPVTADFNGDGILDLAVACLNGGVVSISLGQSGAPGTLSFGPVHNFIVGGSAAHLVTGDFNGDGILDLAVAEIEGRVAILLGTGSGGQGDGNFALPVSYSLGSIARGVATRDFNNDGILDLAVATEAGTATLKGRGTGGVGDGTFMAPVFYGPAAWGVTPADFNADGITDLAYTDGASNAVGVLFGQGSGGVGNGTFLSGPVMDAGGVAQGREVAVADFNGDGAPDFVTNSRDEGMRLFMNTLSGGVATGVFTVSSLGGNVSVNSVKVADFDKDGRPDIVATNSGGYMLMILYNRPPGFSAPVNFATGTAPVGVLAADLNGDGNVDAVVAAAGADKFYAYAGQCVAPSPPPPPYDAYPHIAFVRDVKNDQGGHVFLAWSRSSMDSAGASVITGYRVWRRLPLNASPSAALRLNGRIAPLQLASYPGYWEAIATPPAEKLDGYAYTATTPQDSIQGSNPYSAFFITALTGNPAVFYESAPDSGYSVDNLAPAMLQQASAAYGNGFIALHWLPGREADLAGYRIYRGESASFVPQPSNLISSQPDTGYVDGSTASAYYKIAAIDIHGNLGQFVLLSPAAPTAVGAPSPSFSLGARSNPVTDGRLLVSFSLPTAHPSQLDLLDIGGRVLRRIEVGTLGVGNHIVDLSPGTRMVPGVYFVRLAQDGRLLTQRIAILR